MRLGGLSEVAAELGISRQRVSQLRDQPGFPQPVGAISAGAIWDLDDIAAWNSSDLRRSSGRPTAGNRARILGGRYRLEEPPIGSGGFADVYRAADLEERQGGTRAVVAIKVLRDLKDREVRRRFVRELRIIRSLSHRNVLPILDDGEDEDGRLWFAMPLAEGSLAEEAAQYVGKDQAILRVMRDICAGLSYVHTCDQEIFHRDLKPANILKIGNGAWAIADFGLAREAERVTTALTSTLQGLGTYLYAAPETWTDAKRAQATADIYSLGKILQQLVTGQLPVTAEPPAGNFYSVIQRATRDKPDRRYRTVDEFLRALENVLQGPPDRWETTSEIVERLTSHVRVEVPEDAALEELLDRLLSSDDPEDALDTLNSALPLLSTYSINRLWAMNADGTRRIIEAYSDYVAERSWPFEYCDVIADFFDRVTLTIDDDDIVRSTVAGLVCLGANHNRWHVRNVLARLLQQIRTSSRAGAAVEGLRDASPDQVRWALTDFVIRSLHPVLRAAADDLVSPAT